MSAFCHPRNTAIPGLPFHLRTPAGAAFLGHPASGTWTLGLGSAQTAPLAPDVSPAALQAALEAIPSIGSGRVSVGGDGFPEGAYEVTLDADLSEAGPLAAHEDFPGFRGRIAVAVVAEGMPGANTRYRLTVSGIGSFALSHGADGALFSVAATIEQVRFSLENMEGIGAGNVEVSGGPLGTAPMFITFQGALRCQPVAIEGDFSPLEGSAELVCVQEGYAGRGAVQSIELEFDAPSALIVKDGQAPAPLAGVPVRQGGGLWTVDVTAAEMDASAVGLLFTIPGAVPVHFAILTSVAEGDASFTASDRARLAAIFDKLPAAAYLRGTAEADGGLADAELAQIADSVLSRDVSHVEAAAGLHSLCYTVLAMSGSNTTAHPGRLTVYRTDGVTEFARKTIATTSAAAAITGVGG